MTSIVPQSNRRLRGAVFITQDAQAGRLQQEVSTAARFEPEPASRDHSQEMPAREQQHVPLNPPHSIHDPVGPSADLLRRFPSGAAVAKQLPIWMLCMNLGGAAPLVLAVVPFDQVLIHFGDGPESGQLGGPGCAL